MYHTQREGADWNEGTKQVKVACCKDMQQLSFLPMQYRNGRRPLPSVGQLGSLRWPTYVPETISEKRDTPLIIKL